MFIHDYWFLLWLYISLVDILMYDLLFELNRLVFDPGPPDKDSLLNH